MIAYMKRHERLVLEKLAGELDPAERQALAEEHERQIRWMQHERLVHLLVMLFVCLFALLALGLSLIAPEVPLLVLFGLLTLLAAAYILHYYRLENAIQRWYELAGRIRSRRP
jgi:cytochrome b subunit of formate dehydrogenase